MSFFLGLRAFHKRNIFVVNGALLWYIFEPHFEHQWSFRFHFVAAHCVNRGLMGSKIAVMPWVSILIKVPTASDITKKRSVIVASSYVIFMRRFICFQDFLVSIRDFFKMIFFKFTVIRNFLVATSSFDFQSNILNLNLDLFYAKRCLLTHVLFMSTTHLFTFFFIYSYFITTCIQLRRTSLNIIHIFTIYCIWMCVGKCVNFLMRHDLDSFIPYRCHYCERWNEYKRIDMRLS